MSGLATWCSDALLIWTVSTSNLDGILKEVTKIQTVVNSGRRRDRLRLTVLAGSYQADIKKCYDQLDWTIKEFDVGDG